MNLDNLKSSWQQYKLMNSLDIIGEDEILSIIETEKRGLVWLSYRRVAQNTLIYTFLLTCFSGGCTI
jgi:hypothetical protein